MDSTSRSSKYLTRGLAVFGAGAFALHAWRLGLALLGGRRAYHVKRDRLPAIGSEAFRTFLSYACDAPLHRDTEVTVLRNGDHFYAAELDAIRQATQTINLEAYEFLEGEVTREFLDALIDRARAGVEVRLTVDAIGSWGTHSSYFDSLRAAGGRQAWYHPLNSRMWPYLNNRTHRKLLTVDGAAGFIGGAGFADHWMVPSSQGPPWRDTVFQVRGGAVAALNAVFGQNWAETTGEILAGQSQFPDASAPRAEGVPSLVVSSTPQGGATHARMLYQAVIEAAEKTIHITTPYFVPDRSARYALQAAAKRGVSVKILTAGRWSDHPTTRRVSRMFDVSLAKAGADIYEYRPSMIHAKLMTIDGYCTVAGSTNFDHRSFELNDEVNIVIFDQAVASRIDADFTRDLEVSSKLTTARLQRQDLVDSLVADAGWVLRREE